MSLVAGLFPIVDGEDAILGDEGNWRNGTRDERNHGVGSGPSPLGGGGGDDKKEGGREGQRYCTDGRGI